MKIDSDKLSPTEAKNFYKDVITLIASDAEGLAQGTNNTDDINHDVANGLKEVLKTQMGIFLREIQDAKTPKEKSSSLEQFKTGLSNITGLDYTTISEIAAKALTGSNSTNLVEAFLDAKNDDLVKAQGKSSAPEKLKAIEAIFSDLRESVPEELLSNEDFKNQYITKYRESLKEAGIQINPRSYIRSGNKIDEFSSTEQKEFLEAHNQVPAFNASTAPAQAIKINGEDFSDKLDELKDKQIGDHNAEIVNKYIKAIKATLGDESVSKALKSDKSSEYKASRIANAISKNMSLMREDMASFRIVTRDNNKEIIQAILNLVS